jgi:hypothetical protein
MLNENHGVILDGLSSFTILGGPGDTLPVKRESSDWRDVVPPLEVQRKNGLETMSCCSQGYTNCIEVSLAGDGITENFNARDLARRSSTTKNGNSFYNVQEAAVSGGLSTVPDDEWFDNPSTWDEYYSETKLEREVSSSRSEFFKKYDLGRTVSVGTSIDAMIEGLKKGPLWACNFCHAFVITYVDKKSGRIYVYDSYPSRDGRGDGWFDSNVVEYSCLIPIKKKVLDMPQVPVLEDNILVQMTEPGYQESGRIALHLSGKLWIDDSSQDAVSRTLLVRKFGKGLTKKAWDSFPKVNFKGEPVV